MAKTKEDESARVEKREYLARKRKMIKYEKTNFSTVVFFRAQNGFYTAGGHSAVILYNKLAPELGLKISVLKDRDFEERFSEGVVSIKNVDKYITMLQESKFVKGVKKKDDGIVFQLTKELSKEEYELLAKSDDIKREALQNLVGSSRVMPKTYQALRGVMNVCVHSVEKRSTEVQRQLVTGMIVKLARAALISFLNGCKAKADFSKKMNETEDYLNRILTELLVIEAADVWTIAQCRKISFAVAKALTSLVVERKEYE